MIQLVLDIVTKSLIKKNQEDREETNKNRQKTRKMAGRSSATNQRTKTSSQPRVDYTTVITTAATTWLSPEMIYATLLDYSKMGFPFASHAPVNPVDGQLYLFDKNVVKKYKDDGVNWVRKRTGTDRVLEIYASLYAVSYTHLTLPTKRIV